MDPTSLTLFGIPLKELSQAGIATILLTFLTILWRQLTALQTRYEQVLERCITALTRVNDHLDKE